MSVSVRSQEQVAAAPANDAAAAPAIASPAMPAAARPILPTPARIMGHIQDGTPPPPQPLKPAFVVRAKDVLATTTHQQGGRTITIQKIKPIALPPPPEPATPPAQPDTSSEQEDRAELDVPQPTWDFLFLGVTVFRSKDSPPRSLVNYWANGHGVLSFWSSADFALLSGFVDFAAHNGKTYSLFMAWSYEDIDQMADLYASKDRPYESPVMPDFPDAKATFTVIGNPPGDPSILAPIEALHDIYNHEFARLKAAHEGRESARTQHEAELKANPPRPKNITFHYWRTEKPAPATGDVK